MANILIAGCGKIGTALGIRLDGDGHRVWGLRRQTGFIPKEITPISFDLIRGQGELPSDIIYDDVFYCLAAHDFTDQSYYESYVLGLKNLISLLTTKTTRIFMISSSSVYHQDNGEWVDETSLTQPPTFPGQRILEGEKILRESGFVYTILRLTGIYGPEHDGFLRGLVAGKVHLNAVDTYTNRIHSQDCVAALVHLHKLRSSDQPALNAPSDEVVGLLPNEPATKPRPAEGAKSNHLHNPFDTGEIYLGVDDEPAMRNDVIRWICDQQKIPLPNYPAPPANRATLPLRSATDKPVTPQPRHGSHKRCSNAKLKATGFSFRFPTYREGYVLKL